MLPPAGITHGATPMHASPLHAPPFHPCTIHHHTDACLTTMSCIDLREEAHHCQELWHLGPLPEPDRLPQHVQGVQGHHPERCCGPAVPRDGLSPPLPLPLHPDHQDCHRARRRLQARQHPAGALGVGGVVCGAEGHGGRFTLQKWVGSWVGCASRAVSHCGDGMEGSVRALPGIRPQLG